MKFSILFDKFLLIIIESVGRELINLYLIKKIYIVIVLKK